MNDKRFVDSSFDAGYLDYNATLSVNEMKTLNKKYASEVTSGCYEHCQSNFDELENELNKSSNKQYHVTVFEWESGF